MKKQGREASQRRWAWKRMEDLDKRRSSSCCCLIAVFERSKSGFEGHGRTQQGTLSYLNHKQVLTGGYPSTMVWPCAWGGVRSRRDCHAWLLEKHVLPRPNCLWIPGKRKGQPALQQLAAQAPDPSAPAREDRLRPEASKAGPTPLPHNSWSSPAPVAVHSFSTCCAALLGAPLICKSAL
ncbi:uncharacterized protein LOC130880674 isoform X3 [Chionomys nivalis]|uniref:uncharacterized protein LOC130880674 isoform X3 n=1 Tax=Chionomys nivalis TaxID=269649 RepID=UPI002599CEAC|nr:uncharacterized protein LOC130880674 isoform X3 [Chionomys nivalis]